MFIVKDLIKDFDIVINLKELTFIVILPLALIFIIAGYIGLERQNIGKEAGISAHLLVGLASAGIAILQRVMYKQQLDLLMQGYAVDPEAQRIIAQVLAGVGFIGAGVILKDKSRIIRGITTAATIWTVAIIGIILGSGYIFLGTILGLIIITFISVRDLSRGINPLIPIEKQRTKGNDLDDDNYHF
ncbi:MAG TPA: MgtC/SapB family protein [Acholeplasma sp.]|nr:MgtC/SapB family protein [Acholeplasma sp.]